MKIAPVLHEPVLHEYVTMLFSSEYATIQLEMNAIGAEP